MGSTFQFSMNCHVSFCSWHAQYTPQPRDIEAWRDDAPHFWYVTDFGLVKKLRRVLIPSILILMKGFILGSTCPFPFFRGGFSLFSKSFNASFARLRVGASLSFPSGNVTSIRFWLREVLSVAALLSASGELMSTPSNSSTSMITSSLSSSGPS